MRRGSCSPTPTASRGLQKRLRASVRARSRFHVYPYEHQGEKQQPAFTGLMHAYFLGADESDHSNVMGPRVQPGDTILVHAGVYKDSRFVYGGAYAGLKSPGYGTPFDGTYYLTASGTADKPIVIKAAPTTSSISWPPTTTTSRASPSGTPTWRSWSG
jgi:hypothetical protein